MTTTAKTPQLVKPNVASYLILGILALVIGGALWNYGQQLSLLSGPFESDGQPQTILGAILSLIGVTVTLVGLSGLATNVETIALRVVALDQATATKAETNDLD